MKFPWKIALYVCAFFAGICIFCGLARCDALREREFRRNAGTFSVPEIVASVPEKSAGTLRIASVNTFNYLSTNRRTDDGVYKRRWAKPQSERAALTRLILSVNPDVLALQEIGGNKQVNQLADDVERAGGAAFPHRVVLHGRDTARRVAVLSRLPFRDVFRFYEKNTMCRGLLGVEIAAGTRPLRVFTLHLKSKLTRSPEDPECARERLSEARRVRELLGTAGGNAFVLLGDFNDTPESAPVRIFSEGGFLRRLDLTDSAGERWTYANSRFGYSSIFDHIFLSPQLRGNGCVSDAALSRVRSPLGMSVSASDHRMVFVDVEFP